MAVEFYDVKEGKKVSIDESNITRKVYTRTTKAGKEQQRYAFRGKTSDGRNLTRFVSKADFDASSAAIED
ncbi:MAG: hypothetical protein ACPGQS_11925 [Bradymonadia bacterium]